MQFCSYSTWFAPNNAIERTLPLLLPVLIGILMFMLLSDEKHIKKNYQKSINLCKECNNISICMHCHTLANNTHIHAHAKIRNSKY